MHVGHAGHRGRHRAYCAFLAVYIDVRLGPEVLPVALFRLVPLCVALVSRVLGRVGRTDEIVASIIVPVVMLTRLAVGCGTVANPSSAFFSPSPHGSFR